jgi:hypothetical protein
MKPFFLVKLVLVFLPYYLIISKASAQFSAGLRTGISVNYYADQAQRISVNYYADEAQTNIPIKSDGSIRHRAGFSLTPGLEGYFSYSGSNRLVYRIGLNIFSLKHREQFRDLSGQMLGETIYTRRYIGSSLMAGYRLLDAEKVKITAGLGLIPSVQYYGGIGRSSLLNSGGLPETHRINSPYYRFLLLGALSLGAEIPLGKNWIFTLDSVWSGDLYKLEKQKYTKDSGPDAWKVIGNLPEKWHFLSSSLMPGIKYQFQKRS